MIISLICSLFHRLCVFPTDAVLYRIFVLYALLLLSTSHLFFHRTSGYGLLVAGLSNLTEINLLSLKRVGAGLIVIFHNPELCYIAPLMFKSIISNHEKQRVVVGNNKQPDKCSMYYFGQKNLEEC